MILSDIACQERKKNIISIYGEIIFTNTSCCCVFPVLAGYYLASLFDDLRHPGNSKSKLVLRLEVVYAELLCPHV